MINQGPILRIFEARTKPGRAGELLEKFASTSAAVVTGEPGNQGYIFGHSLNDDDNVVLFMSAWKDLASIKTRFGEHWQISYMPEGYSDMIEECSVRHFDMNGGWHLEDL